MAGKRTYSFSEGKILRKGLVIGQYDQTTRKVIDLEPSLPKQMRSILNGMLWRESGPGVETVSREKEQSEFESKYPPPPPMDPKLGDKTPAYVEWSRTTHPEQFIDKYKGRKYGPVPHVGGDIPEIPMDKPEERWGPGA